MLLFHRTKLSLHLLKYCSHILVVCFKYLYNGMIFLQVNPSLHIHKYITTCQLHHVLKSKLRQNVTPCMDTNLQITLFFDMFMKQVTIKILFSSTNLMHVFNKHHFIIITIEYIPCVHWAYTCRVLHVAAILQLLACMSSLQRLSCCTYYLELYTWWWGMACENNCISWPQHASLWGLIPDPTLKGHISMSKNKNRSSSAWPEVNCTVDHHIHDIKRLVHNMMLVPA